MGILAGILGILPLVTNVVHSVEGIFGSGNGAKKKEAATAAISDVLNIYGAIQPSVSGAPAINNSDLMAGIGQVIDGIVKILNATGTFKKSV